MTRVARTFLMVALVMAAPMTTRAQQRDTSMSSNILPADVAREAIALFNATMNVRVTDQLDIVAGRTITGDVSVLNGPVIVAGHVTGRVLAINADVLLQPGARIDGDLLIVGGEVEGRTAGMIGGEVRVYHAALRFARAGDQLVAVAEEPTPDENWWQRFDRARRRNSNRLEVANAGVYNRVEGLPVRIGPVLYRDQGWGHFKFGAAAIVRTASSFSSATPDVGHDVRAELRVGREYGATFSTRLFEVVDGVEQWQLSNAEASLASFLFHRDYRDYYGRHGGQLAVAFRATDEADLTLSYSDERWRSRDTRNPLAILGQLTWRENPAVDEGRFHVATLSLRIDTRNNELNPREGWYVLAELERGVGSIDVAGPTSPGVRVMPTGTVRYQRSFMDVRRYNRLSPSSSLNLRVVVGGWLSGDPIPLERRLSIDGPGTVPGFDFRTSNGPDVGTCATSNAPPGRPAQCERVALGQLEYRNDLHISITDRRDGIRRTRLRADGAWVFFADAGRGWLVNAPDSPLTVGRSTLPSLSTYRTDIGGGIDFDVLGVYLAKALSEPTEPTNVFVRVRHRF